MQAIPENKSKTVAVLGTGGTIAGTALRGASGQHGNLAYVSAQLGVQALLAAVPGLADLSINLQSEQVAQLDSKDMGFDEWQHLALRTAHHLSQPDVLGVVITHGTDTLEETAYFLDCVLPAHLLVDKPVVITCAMRPATSSEADGPQNLADAVKVAIEPGACGVVAVCAGQIHSARHVQKVHTYRLDAFDSGDAGPLGRVMGGKVLLAKVWPKPGMATPTDFEWGRADRPLLWPRVEIVMSHAGANGQTVDAMLACQSESGASPVMGIVVAGSGNGTVHRSLQAVLVRAQDAGIRVWRATRCAYGAVQSVPGQVLQEVTSLSPVKARIALALALLPSTDPSNR